MQNTASSCYCGIFGESAFLLIEYFIWKFRGMVFFNDTLEIFTPQNLTSSLGLKQVVVCDICFNFGCQFFRILANKLIMPSSNHAELIRYFDLDIKVTYTKT